MRFDGLPLLPILAMVLATGCGGAATPVEGEVGVVVAIPSDHRLGGTATGTNPGVVLTLIDAAAGRATIPKDGPFWFERRLAKGTPYSASIESLAPGAYCSIANGSGVMDSHDRSDIEVTCRTVGPTVSPSPP
jgi:hypothetical protein